MGDNPSLDQWQSFAEHLRHVCSVEKGIYYDIMVLLSGGKDSAYMLFLLNKIGVRLLAVTIDFGFISKATKENIAQVLKELSIEHLFITPPWEDIEHFYRLSILKTGKLCIACEAVTTIFAYRIASMLRIPCMAWGMPSSQFRTPPPWIVKVESTYWSKIKKKYIDRLERIADHNTVAHFKEKYLPPEEGDFFPKFLIFPLLAVEYSPRQTENVVSVLGWKRPIDVVSTSSNCYATHLHMYLGWKTQPEGRIEELLESLIQKQIIDEKLRDSILNMPISQERANEILHHLGIDISADALAHRFLTEGKTINPFGSES